MSDLREGLDRALRTVTFGEAPVEPAKRAGRRIRIRRRAGLLAGALAVVAVAAGYPALTGSGASAPPTPMTSQWTPPPTPKLDPPVSSYVPLTATTGEAGRLTSKTGEIGVGYVDHMAWRVSVVPPGPKNPVPADSCYTITITEDTDVGGTPGPCNDISGFLGNGLGADKPAAFTWLSNNGATVMTVGEAANDVAFFTVLFTDGQQFNLNPIAFGGHRYFAWMAPLNMPVASVTAHLGSFAHPTQTVTAVPFQLKGQPPTFGLWQQAGQAAPPRAMKVIGSGTTGRQAWKTLAYEGPWGTCFGTGPDGFDCVPIQQLRGTDVLGGWGGSPPEPAAFGSAAPGVALVRIALSDGTTVQARPVAVGNEDLFAFPIGKDLTPKGWTAYDASGMQVGTGSVPST